MGWKIKVLTPSDTVKFWYVTGLKNGGISFSGTTCVDDAKVYRNRKSFQKLLDHIESCSGAYELIEVKE